MLSCPTGYITLATVVLCLMTTVVGQGVPNRVRLTKSPHTKDVEKGHSLTLLAIFQFQAKPLAVHVQWFKQNRPLPIWTATASFSDAILLKNASMSATDFAGITGSLADETMKDSHGIRFLPVDLEHTGSYYCVLTYWSTSSQNHTTTSKSIDVSVIDPPLPKLSFKDSNGIELPKQVSSVTTSGTVNITVGPIKEASIINVTCTSKQPSPQKSVTLYIRRNEQHEEMCTDVLADGNYTCTKVTTVTPEQNKEVWQCIAVWNDAAYTSANYILGRKEPTTTPDTNNEDTATTTATSPTTSTAAKPASTSITPAGSSPTRQSTNPSPTNTGQPTRPTTPTTPATRTPTRPSTLISTSTQSPKGEVPGGTEGQSSRNSKNAILAVGVVSGVAAVVGIVFAVLMALKRKKALDEEKKKALFRSFSLPQEETATV